MTSGSPAGGSPGEPALAVDGLRVHFRTPRGLVHAVDGVSFALERGRTLGVVGESGSGKSVLIRAVMRLLPAQALVEGEVRFDGRDLRALSEREMRALSGSRMAMVFQDPATSLNPVIRVGRQITESLRLHLGLRGAAARARALELMESVGIPEPRRRLHNYPHEMSGGMRQRVCIAIAIACTPDLLFADEPTTALDVTVQRQVLDLLGSLRERHGMAMLLVSHDLGVVAGRADRVMVMYAGQVVESASAAELFDRPRHPYTSALLRSIPRLALPEHTRLAGIPGRPAEVVGPAPGCRFAPRCSRARPRCLSEDPPLTVETLSGHAARCFYPIGTPRGADALAANRAAGRTAAGLDLRGDDDAGGAFMAGGGDLGGAIMAGGDAGER